MTERITLNQDGRQEVLTLGQAGAQGATGPAGPDDASGISIEDVGEYFTATDVEEALAEVGAVIAELPTPTTWLTSVLTVTDAELVYPFTGTQSGVGGVSEQPGDRVLVKDQTDITQNGIWIVAVGEWTRSTDTVDRRFDNATVAVDSGTYAGREYRVGYNGGVGGWLPLLTDPYIHTLEGGYPHSAIDIPFITGTYNTGGQNPTGTVKAALEYLDPALFNLTQHLNDAADAHDAAAVSATYNLNDLHVTGTRSNTVQKALNEFEVLAHGTYPLGVLQLTLTSWDSGDTFKVTDGSTDDDTVITWHATDNAADLETLFRSDPWGWSWFANCIVTEPSAGVFNFDLFPEDDQGYATNKPDPTEIAAYFALWGETGGVTGVFSAVQPSFTTGGAMILTLGAQSGYYIEGVGRTKGADTDFNGNAGTAGDGAHYTVKNTTDGKVYLTTRAAGTWYSVETFTDANDTALTDHIATPQAWDNHGIPQVSLTAGADETVEHDIFVSGMQENDIVIKVLVMNTAASVDTIIAHPGTHTAKNGGITISNEVDNTGNKYLIFWIDTHEP